MKRIDYAAEATADIADIWDYTEERWGYAQAVAHDARIEAQIKRIATGQAASRTAEEVGPGLRRALVGSHVVFFREDAAAVTVVRVLHQRMDVGRGKGGHFAHHGGVNPKSRLPRKCSKHTDRTAERT